MKRLYPILIMIMLILTACGPKAIPTPDLVDVQNTAIAIAWTWAAETQTAMPTATPVPPTATSTPTLMPTMTMAPTIPPANDALSLPTATPATGGDPCNKTLSSWTGPEAKLLIVNEVKGTVNLSIYLNETAFACGYAYANFNDKGQTLMTVPYGCYSMYGWVTTKKGKEYTVSGYGCINNPDKWTLVIRDERILLLPP